VHTFPTIPGVTLQVRKEDRVMTPKDDGHVGQLFSGTATLLAIVDPGADHTIGILRQGDDNYQKIWNWLVDPATMDSCPDAKEKQRQRQEFLVGEEFEEGTKIYGRKINLMAGAAHDRRQINTVHYPENMLAIAQYVQSGDHLTGQVHVWEAALVSQHGEFFLTVHRHYHMSACRYQGEMVFPRLYGHRILARILRESSPTGMPTIDVNKIVPIERSTGDPNLRRYEGVVESWYYPRNMGTIITNQGVARVHWSQVPQRNPSLLRFLKEGERVKFAELRIPEENPRTEWRPVRKAEIKFEVVGVEIA